MILLPREDTRNCTRIDEQPATDPVVGSWTFYKLMGVISGTCTGLTWLICLALISMHLRNQRNVGEQKLIIRIIWLPATWSLFSLAAVRSYDAAHYLEPIPLLMEAIAVAAMFELFITFLVPMRSEREAYFANADLLNRKRVKMDDSGSLIWYKKIYVQVYQFPVTFVLLTLFSEGLAAADCPTNRVYTLINILVQVGSAMSTFFCVWALLVFVDRFKTELKPGGAWSKFFMLKGVVGLTTMQKLVINILDKAHLVNGNNKISHYDWTIGFPDMLINVEMLLAALCFVWAYSWLPYQQAPTAAFPLGPVADDTKKISTIRFLWAGLYFPDLFVGVRQSFAYVPAVFTSFFSRKPRDGRPTAKRSRMHSEESYSRLVGSQSQQPGAERYELSRPHLGSAAYADSSYDSTRLQTPATSGSTGDGNANRQSRHYSQPVKPQDAQIQQRPAQSSNPPSYSQ